MGDESDEKGVERGAGRAKRRVARDPVAGAERRHFAVAVETLGDRLGSVVLEVGAVQFFPSHGHPFREAPPHPLSIRLSVSAQQDLGARVSARSMERWTQVCGGVPVAAGQDARTPLEARRELFEYMNSFGELEGGPLSDVTVWYPSLAHDALHLRCGLAPLSFGPGAQEHVKAWPEFPEMDIGTLADYACLAGGRTWGQKAGLSSRVAWVRAVDAAVRAWSAVQMLGVIDLKTRESLAQHLRGLDTIRSAVTRPANHAKDPRFHPDWVVV